jgi:hypothetical protein
MAYLQEILVNEQLDREFTWSTTEVAYPYNSTTKVSKFQPLTRPYFMHETAKPLKIMKIPRNLMPMGEVHDSSGMEKLVQKEIEDQKAAARRNDDSLQDD